MKIWFKIKTEDKTPMINTVQFKLSTGTVLTIDRVETRWRNEDGYLYMEWINPYLWEVDGYSIFKGYAYLGDAIDMLDKADLIHFEMEDESEFDYNKSESVEWRVK